ncbi:MAG TPA: thermonuclease family protein, partial [Anaerolineae bacterium]|nr:thermonuclease family protein [Anaerolineae bacterium]
MSDRWQRGSKSPTPIPAESVSVIRLLPTAVSPLRAERPPSRPRAARLHPLAICTILVDTPERDQPFEAEATEANRALVEGKTVWLEKDVSDVDRYGRLLRYVYLEQGQMVQEQLLLLGLAKVATYPPDVKYVDQFLARQKIAQDTAAGIWADQPPGVALVRVYHHNLSPVESSQSKWCCLQRIYCISNPL